MSTIPTTFSPTDDLSTVLTELTTQASALLSTIHVIQNTHATYTSSSNLKVKSDLAVVLLQRVAAMESDLGIIKLNARLINEERLEAWAGSAGSAAEMMERRERLRRLCERMEELGTAVGGLRGELDRDGESS